MKKDSHHKAGRGAIDWPTRLPDLSDEEIANLLRNAHRLRTASPDAVQAEAAAELVPVIEEEMAARRARRAAASAKKPAAKPTPAVEPPAAKPRVRVRTARSKQAADA
jgi:hypothetical protein